MRHRQDEESSDFRQHREGVEQPVGEGRELSGHHGDAHEDQDEACRDLQDTAETPEGLETRRQAVREERRQEEGHTEAKGVDGEQGDAAGDGGRSEGHTSELQSLMRISYAVFCLKKKKKKT